MDAVADIVRHLTTAFCLDDDPAGLGRCGVQLLVLAVPIPLVGSPHLGKPGLQPLVFAHLRGEVVHVLVQAWHATLFFLLDFFTPGANAPPGNSSWDLSQKKEPEAATSPGLRLSLFGLLPSLAWFVGVACESKLTGVPVPPTGVPCDLRLGFPEDMRPRRF